MLDCVRGMDVVDSPQLHRQSPRRKHFYTWVATDQRQLARTERLVLHGLPYHQAMVAGINTISTDDITCYDDGCSSAKTEKGVGAAGDTANLDPEDDAFISSSDGDEREGQSREVVVLIHGFAGGVGGWAQNWGFLAERYRLYAIDLPGFARSERRETKASTLEDSMQVMTEYLERWFRRLNFGRKVVVIAHSFGCFVSAHFAMRHPAYLKALVMAEPWGINKADPSRLKTFPFAARMLLKVFYASNPLTVLRGLGPAGPYVFKKTRPDFRSNWSRYYEDPNIMYDYLYHCNARSPAVGEQLFRVCCHCDVAAKVPLPEVLPMGLSHSIPIGFLFGADSWIKKDEALLMAERMRELGFVVATDTVSKAGHQIFTDNVDEFNEKVTAMVEELLPRVAVPEAQQPSPVGELNDVFHVHSPLGVRAIAVEERR